MVTALRRPATAAVLQGDIWLAALNPTVGVEIQKTRPCLVISPPEMLRHLRMAIVAPMTTGSRPAPWRVAIRFDGKDGLILLDQLRALDKQRLIRRLGSAPSQTLSHTLERLRQLFAP